MDDERLLNAIDAAESRCYGASETGEIEDDRASAIDAYLGKNTLPAPAGRSQVVDRTVYETIQWIMPSLCRIFANGDDVVDLPPIGPDDEEGAKQEGQYLNYLITQKNAWFSIFSTAAKDALLSKTGYLYVCREKRRIVEVERYERQTPQSLALLIGDPDVEVTGSREYPDPDYVPQPAVGPDGAPMVGPDGRPMMQPAPMLYDVEIRRAKEDNPYIIKALPPERCKVSQDTPEYTLKGCPYFEYFDYQTLSDLRASGYDVDDDIGADDESDSEVDFARDQYGETISGASADVSQRRVKVRYIWLTFDHDEDGIAELQYVLLVGKTILLREECNRIPVAALACDPLPHRHPGLSIADTTQDIQQIKTVLQRQGLDNLYLSNNPRTFVNPDRVNLDDLLISRPGGVIRGSGVFGQDIAPFSVPFVFPQVVESMAYFEQVTEGRTGVNRYFQGTDQNALNKTATGIQQLSTMAAQRVETIARYMASGIEDMAAILHELVLKSGHQREVIRLRGKWVEVDPAEWRNRYDFRICVGYSAGNKDAQMARLQMIAGFQKEAAARGVPIVQPQNLYETAIELTKAADFSSPERFWTDPATVPPPPPPQPDPTVMAAEGVRAQSSLQTKQLEVSQRERDSERDFAIKKYEIDTKAQTDLQKQREQAEHAAQLEGVRGTVQAALKQRDGEQAAASRERELALKQQPALEVAGQVQQLAQRLEDAIGSLQGALQVVLTAKRTIRRGKDGKAEGVDIVGPDGAVIAQQSIVKGADGRIVGVQ